MLKVGDIVKVKSKVNYCGEMKEYIPIGTICKVVEMESVPNGCVFRIIPLDQLPVTPYDGFWYLETEVEKGHLEWVKDD